MGKRIEFFFQKIQPSYGLILEKQTPLTSRISRIEFEAKHDTICSKFTASTWHCGKMRTEKISHSFYHGREHGMQ